MSRMAVDDLFYGNPERVRFVAGGSGSGIGSGYDGSFQTGTYYHSDGEDYHSHRRNGQLLYPSATTGRPMLPDVQLSVPMDGARCVEKVKEALDIRGVYSIHCDVPSQTVTVSGNIAPQALLKRAKQVKRKAKILSYTSIPNNSSRIAPHHVRTSSAYGAPVYGSSTYDTSYYRSGRMPSPPRNYAYYSQHAIAHPTRNSNLYQPSRDHRYSNYY